MTFSADEIQSYLARDEGLFLDFKSLWEGPREAARVRARRQVRDEIAHHVAAFANAEGGVLILGVEDNGRVSGHGYSSEVLRDFGRVPTTRLEPPLAIEMQGLTVEGHELLVFDVPNHPNAVMVQGDGFPLRVQDTVVLESEERINARKQAARAVAWEQIHRPEASLDDLDLDFARKFLNMTPQEKKPLEEALARYRAIDRGPRGLHVTNAGLLLFAKQVARWHPRAGVRIFRVAGKERLHGSRRNVQQFPRIEGPLPRLITDTLGSCAAQIRKSEKLHNLFFREFPEYPDFAWLEAVVNAVAHRDYSEQGREIEVWFYDDRMEISSPGLLVEPVTLEDLRARRAVHVSRNPLLVRVLVESGIMREEGEGIPRMFQEMEESFLPPPQFEESAGTFRVTLRNTPILDAGNPDWQAILKELPLTTAQKRVLVANPGGFTSADYQTLNRVDRDRAYREIQDLVSRGVVTPPTRRGRAARYRVSPDLTRELRWRERRLPEVREHFTRNERLTNTDYRKMFDLPRGATVRELRELVDRGVLVLRGERRGAHYVPGPVLAAEK